MNAPAIIAPPSVLDGYAQPMPMVFQLPEAVIAAGPDAWEACFWAIRLADTRVLDDWIWHIEVNSYGELELTMFPGPPYDLYHGELAFALYKWNKEHDRLGLLSSSKRTAYRLSNGAVRRPALSWTSYDNVIVPESPFLTSYRNPPDFAAEVRSDIHTLPVLLDKMREYIDNGTRLCWLIDPLERTTRIYRAGADEPELLHSPETLDGENVLPGFVFEVRQQIFDLLPPF